MAIPTPVISPQVTRQGIEELHRRFPKIRDYDQYWDGLKRRLNPDIHRIIEYGSVDYEDRTYVLRAIETGETGYSAKIFQAATHGYEQSGPRAMENSSMYRGIYVPIAMPRAFEHDLRFVIGQKADGEQVLTDTNRDFPLDSSQAETEEAKHLINYYQSLPTKIMAFADLHETPIADVTIWRPFAEKYKGRVLSDEERTSVPQGAFVIVEKRDDVIQNKAQIDFGHAVMDRISEFSPRAPELIVLGKPNDRGVTQGGPLEGSTRTFMTRLGAENVVITELNPDMSGMTKGLAMQAQMAAIEAVLNF